MAIHNEVIREGSEGIIKQIEMSAISLLFDNVQKNQYSEPEKSTIRELVSNAKDAIMEKITALEILNGEKKAEDYYLQREEAMYADSNFLPEYYDEAWLDTYRNTVQITYIEAQPGMAKDQLIIEDYGVGIGHIINPKTGQSRLQGVLKISYSTKRNSNIALGKFGIGAKAALSTGQDSYTMITRHNGKEYHFEVYDYKADSIVPKFNMETGEENPTFVFNEGKEDEYVGRYLKTTEKNGTIIKVAAGRYARKFYENGVRSQLLYFKGVKFDIIRENGVRENIDFTAKIQYESDNLILAENTQFSKPHILLNGVNYGYVNYERLELNDKNGSIAYKISPEAVTVHPSRESLIWDQRTRAALLAHDKIVSEEAASLIAKEMLEDDLIKWLRKGAQALGDNRDPSSILGKILGQVDKVSLEVIFSPDPTIKYKANPSAFFIGLEPIHVTRESVKLKGGDGYGYKVQREKMKSWTNIDKPLYIQKGKTDNKKEKFLLLKHPDGFIKLKTQDLDSSWMEAGTMSEEDQDQWKKLKHDEEYRNTWEGHKSRFQQYLLASSEVNIYDDVIVPKEMKDDDDDDDDEEKSEAEKQILAKLTPAEERALLGEIVCSFPMYQNREDNKQFTWGKSTASIKDVINDEADVIYAFGDDDDEQIMHLVANMLTEGNYEGSWGNKKSYEFYNNDFKLVRISRSIAKHYKNHTYIRDFILSINPKTKSIAMHSKLVNWHTSRKIEEVLNKMAFLANFSRFNPEIAKDYADLIQYRAIHYRSVNGSSKFGCEPEMLDSLNAYADKVIALQDYIAEHPGNTEAIAAQSKALFEQEEGEDTFEIAVGVDLPVYQKLKRVLEYVKPLENIFNYIKPLVDGGHINPGLEMEIREIMSTKGIK